MMKTEQNKKYFQTLKMLILNHTAQYIFINLMGGCQCKCRKKSEEQLQKNVRPMKEITEKNEEKASMFKSETHVGKNPISKDQIVSYNKSVLERVDGIQTFLKTKSNLKTQQTYQEQGKISVKLLKQVFTQSKNQLPVFFQNLQQKIYDVYMFIAKKALQKMNKKQMNLSRAKVFISQNILWENIKILQLIAAERKKNYDQQVFQNLNESQKKILQYLKTKYPRIGISYVPEDLAKNFREFNFIEATQNDMLRGANITFSDENEKQINLKLKKMFNNFIDGVNRTFPIFKNFLEKEVFNPQNSQKKISNYKIGRKLPENIGKYSEDLNSQFAINSPQISRIMIKWISDLQKLILSSAEVKSKNFFKTYKNENGNINCSEDFDFSAHHHDKDLLIDLLNQESNKYKEQIADLRKELDQFNINLLRILNETKRKQRQVPEKETKVIKFAVYNSKLISWFLIRQIIYIIKHLINASKKFKGETTKTWILDLVKFDVSDLLRALISGSKNDIITVYQRLKKLEESGDIKIVKIKNRFGQAMNDAMIIFKIFDKNSKGPFILCQLQLILVEEHASDTQKNIDFLNHFLYALERSPFGVLSELSITLDYQDSKVRYEKKITFQKRPFNISDCKRQHHAVTFHSKQVKPILCSICSTFYMPKQCILGYKYCQQCNRYICSNLHCLFNENKADQKKSIINKCQEKIKQMIPSSLKNSDSQLKQFLFKSDHDHNLAEITQNFSFKHLVELLKAQDNKYKVNFDNNNKRGYFFFLIRFKGFDTFINLYFWNSKGEEIQNTLSKQKLKQNEKLCFSSYDFLKFVQLQQQKIKKKQIQTVMNNLIILSDDQETIKREREIFVYEMPDKNTEKDDDKKSQNKLIYLALSKLPQKSKKIYPQGNEIEYFSLQFNTDLFSQDREQFKQKFHYPDSGVSQVQLKIFFQKECDWKDKIKSINLVDNLITEAEIFFRYFPNIKDIYLSNNYISQIDIKQKLKELRNLVCFNNNISQVSGLEKAENLTLLNFENNSLQSFETVTLRLLLELIIGKNPMHDFTSIENCGFQNLQNFDFRGSEYQVECLTISFPALKRCILSNNTIQRLNIQSSSLEYLQCRNCQIQNLHYKSKQIQYLYLDGNVLKNFNELFSTEEAAKSLKNLRVFHAPQLKKLKQTQGPSFPIFRSDHLKQVNLSQTDFYGDIENIKKWDSPKIQKLSIDFRCNSAFTFPKLNFPNLKQLQLPELKYNSLEHLQNSNLDSITVLNLDGNIDVEQKMPVLKLRRLEQLSLKNFRFNKFSFLSRGTLPKIQIISLNNLVIDQLPHFNQQTLTDIIISQVKAQKRVQYYKFQLAGLQNLSISGDCFSYFPQIKCPWLQTLKFQQKYINSLERLKNCQSQNLYSLEIQNCENLKQKRFPELRMSSLKKLKIKNCNINDLENISNLGIQKIEIEDCDIKSLPIINSDFLQQFTCFSTNEDRGKLQDIENLKEWECQQLITLNLSNNKIKKLPKISFRNLQNFYFGNNPIQDASQYQKSNIYQDSFNLQNSENLKVIPFVENLRYELFVMEKNQTIQQINNKNLNNLQADQLKIRKFRVQTVNLSVLTNIRRLQIVESHISDIISQPKINLHNFLEIDLTDNNISQWNIFQLSSLQSLNLSKNHLKQFCIPPGKMPSLQVLIIRQNIQLEKVGKLTQSSLRKIEIGQARDLKVDFFDEYTIFNLQQLVFENSSISEIQYIPCCTICSFKNNNINSLQKISQAKLGLFSPYYYNQLREINFQNNSIANLPDTWVAPQLKIMNFSDNKFKQIKISQGANFSSLEDLDFSCNEIKQTNWISTNLFPQLSKVNLSSNKIKKFPNFNGFMNLEKVELDYNPIRQFQNVNNYDNSFELQYLSYSIHPKLSEKASTIYNKLNKLASDLYYYQIFGSSSKEDEFSQQSQSDFWQIYQEKRIDQINKKKIDQGSQGSERKNLEQEKIIQCSCLKHREEQECSLQ